MDPNELMQAIENKRFRRVLNGYKADEVDRYLRKIGSRYREVYMQKERLEQELNLYKQQETALKMALIRAEQVADSVKEKAKQEAGGIIKNVFENVDKLNDRLKISQLLYEEETYRLTENFYSVIRKHIEQIEFELMAESNSFFSRVHQELNPQFEIEGLDLYDSREKREQLDNSRRNWLEKEEAILVGCRLQDNLLDEHQEILFPKETIITPDIIRLAIEKGLYGNLIMAVEDTSVMEGI